jgi:hypothetical protein
VRFSSNLCSCDADRWGAKPRAAQNLGSSYGSAGGWGDGELIDADDSQRAGIQSVDP